MTAFILACAAMLAAAALWLLVPLWRPRPAMTTGASASAPAGTPPARERLIAGIAVGLLPILAILMYVSLSQWDWRGVEEAAQHTAEMDDLLRQLEQKLAQNPSDIEGWLLLGRSNTGMGRYSRAVDAYERAYELSQGRNVEALVGLGEALVLSDETTLTTRARALFEEALRKAPDHPKALWYGSIAALQADELRLGRDRLQRLLAQNPPDELRGVIERQIQDLDQQLAGQAEAAARDVAASGTAAQGSIGSTTANLSVESDMAAQRRVRVTVTLAAALREQLKEPLPLFILARDPSGGPPLAAQRHSSADLPLTIELSERDAMVPTHTIAQRSEIQVVARVSRHGSPQAQSGDLYGEADYTFGTRSDDSVLNITIDRIVP